MGTHNKAGKDVSIGLDNPGFKDDQHELENIKSGKLDIIDILDFPVKMVEKSDSEEISEKRCQFHQHFMRGFFVQKFSAKLLKYFYAKIFAQMHS